MRITELQIYPDWEEMSGVLPRDGRRLFTRHSNRGLLTLSVSAIEDWNQGEIVDQDPGLRDHFLVHLTCETAALEYSSAKALAESCILNLGMLPLVHSHLDLVVPSQHVVLLGRPDETRH